MLEHNFLYLLYGTILYSHLLCRSALGFNICSPGSLFASVVLILVAWQYQGHCNFSGIGGSYYKSSPRGRKRCVFGVILRKHMCFGRRDWSVEGIHADDSMEEGRIRRFAILILIAHCSRAKHTAQSIEIIHGQCQGSKTVVKDSSTSQLHIVNHLWSIPTMYC